MTDKIQSISMYYETLKKGIERLFHTVKVDNQNLLKCYDKLSDRSSLQKGNLHAIQIISKDEKI